MLPIFLQLLTTASSEVSNRTLFKSRFTRLVPDIFFLIFYMTVFLFSGVLDIFFTFCLFFNGRNLVVGAIFLGTIILTGIIEFGLERNTEECLPSVRVNKFFVFCVSITGFNAVINSIRLGVEIYWMIPKIDIIAPLRCFTYPFFHTDRESLSAIKIHCFLSSAMKNLPRLFVLSIFLLQSQTNDLLALVGGILILLNMIVFSFTMAITFPLRPTPRVFTTSFCVLFNAFNKFMATMSSCGAILALFATVYKSIRYYTLLVPAVRLLIWGWPCWKTLKSRNFHPPLSTFCFLFYFIVFTFFSSFIYIHPFEGIGKLHYYVFYFLEFIEEIIIIYMFTEASIDHVTEYFVFRAVMIGFLSSFGMINILHKYKDEKTKFGCVSFTTTMTSEKNEKNLIHQ